MKMVHWLCFPLSVHHTKWVCRGNMKREGPFDLNDFTKSDQAQKLSNHVVANENVFRSVKIITLVPPWLFKWNIIKLNTWRKLIFISHQTTVAGYYGFMLVFVCLFVLPSIRMFVCCMNTGFAQAWKILENEGQSWKVLENKICLEKSLKTDHRPWKVLEFHIFLCSRQF